MAFTSFTFNLFLYVCSGSLYHRDGFCFSYDVTVSVVLFLTSLIRPMVLKVIIATIGLKLIFLLTVSIFSTYLLLPSLFYWCIVIIHHTEV